MRPLFLSIITLALTSLACSTLLPATPTPDITEIFNPPATATPSMQGLSRSDPMPMGSTLRHAGWEVRVTQFARGDEAWRLIKKANQFNEPPAEGYEYVLLRLSVRNTSTATTRRKISNTDFLTTGSANREYFAPGKVPPEPALNGELKGGEEMEGWAVFIVSASEHSLLLILDPLDDSETRLGYLALDSSPSLGVDGGLAQIPTNSIGKSAKAPASAGELVVAENWELTLLEVIHGDEAWQRIYDTNRYNDPPPADRQYYLVKLRIRNINTTDQAVRLFSSNFTAQNENEAAYHLPSIVTPELSLDDGTLYPGGEIEGWLVLDMPLGVERPLLVFAPTYPLDEPRYFKLW